MTTNFPDTRDRRPASAPAAAGTSEKQSVWTTNVRLFDRITPAKVAMLARTMQTMFTAGMPLNESLLKLADLTYGDSPKLATILRQVHHNVEKKGLELGDAFRPYERQLGPIFVELIDAGAKTGTLDSAALPAIVRIYDIAAEARAAKATAMIQPIAVLLASFVLTYVAANVIIPGIRPLFDLPGKHHELPLITQIVLAYTSLWTNVWGWLALAVVFAIVTAAIVAVHRSPGLRPKKDRLKLRVPVYNLMWEAEAISEVLSTMSAMIGAGIPLQDTLEITARTSPNWAYAEAIRKCREEVAANGSTLYDGLKNDPAMPQLALMGIEIGEDTGTLEATTKTIADHYFNYAAKYRKRIDQVTEYLIIAFLGGYVGLIIVSIFVPMYQAIDTLSGR